MLRMKVQTTDTKSPQHDKVMDSLRQAKNAYVTIGVHQDAGVYPGRDAPDVVQVALWNEFGTRTSPARSFVRAVVDENESQINAWREEAIQHILVDGWSVERALGMIGFKIQVLIQNRIKSNVPPPYGTGKKPNDQTTIKKRQDAKRAQGFPAVTLMATKTLLRSIAYKVVVS